MVFDATNVAGVGTPDDDRQLNLAACAVTHLGDMGDDLLESGVTEGIKLHFNHRSHAVDRHADGGSHDSSFGQWGITDASLAEFGVQSVGHSEDTAERTDVFAE